MPCKGCQRRRKKITNAIQRRKDAYNARMATIKFLPGDRVQKEATTRKEEK